MSKKTTKTPTHSFTQNYTNLIAHTLISVAAAAAIIFDKHSAHSARIALAGLLLLFSAIGLFHYRYHQAIATKIFLYEFILGVGVVFYAPINSPFTYAWIFPLLLVHYYYGKKATLGNLLLLAAVLESQLFWQSYTNKADISANAAIAALVQFCIITSFLALSIDHSVKPNR